MRLKWPVYVLTAGIFFLFAMGVQFISLGKTSIVGLFIILTILYAWVAWIMVKQNAVLELHTYQNCSSCGELTPSQGNHCMVCGEPLS
jgi:hypothetical protein